MLTGAAMVRPPSIEAPVNRTFNRAESYPLTFKRLACPIDVFFLQIQCSGRVRLRGGQVVRVGFAGRNGWPYVAIGKLLVDRGQLERTNVSMQSIRAWLEQHPAEAAGVMAENSSYVFFRELTGLDAKDGPIGALGAALTPARSLAVDRAYIPLVVPVWVDTTGPLDDSPMQRLMLAQDIGGAIRGPVRGTCSLAGAPRPRPEPAGWYNTGGYSSCCPVPLRVERLWNDRQRKKRQSCSRLV
jgi:membrane-bound lytic murein transglycosylase